MSALRAVLQNLHHVDKDLVDIHVDLLVPEAKDAIPERGQIAVAMFVAAVLGMLKAVQFDDQFLIRTDKIDDIGTDRNLTSKLVAVQEAIADMRPEDRLRVGRIEAHLSGPFPGQFG